MTAEDRTNGRIGAATRWGTATHEDRKAGTRSARKAFITRMERLADPNGVMSPAELEEAVKHQIKAHMLRMAAASAKARRRKTA